MKKMMIRGKILYQKVEAFFVSCENIFAQKIVATKNWQNNFLLFITVIHMILFVIINLHLRNDFSKWLLLLPVNEFILTNTFFHYYQCQPVHLLMIDCEKYLQNIVQSKTFPFFYPKKALIPSRIMQKIFFIFFSSPQTHPIHLFSCHENSHELSFCPPESRGESWPRPGDHRVGLKDNWKINLVIEKLCQRWCVHQFDSRLSASFKRW